MKATELKAVTRARPAPFVLALVALFLVPVVVIGPVGCSSDDDPANGKRRSSDSSGGDSVTDTGVGGEADELRSEARKLIAWAKKENADEILSKSFKRAAEYYRKARAAAGNADSRTAARYYKLAIRRLESLREEHGKIKSKLIEAENAKEAAEKARKEAVAANAKENAPEDFEMAEESLARGVKALKSPTVTKVSSAIEDFAQAKSDFEYAEEVASKNAQIRAQAEAEKAAVERWKGEAQKAGVDKKALSDWVAASQRTRDAERQFATGNFNQALASYKRITQMYVRAIQKISSDEAMKEMMARAEKEREEYIKTQREFEMKRLKLKQETELAKEAEKTKRAESQGTRAFSPPPFGPGSVATAGPSQADVFGAQSPDDYIQELSPEDEEYLIENVQRLAKTIVYDPATAAVLLDYNVGRLLRIDLSTNIGRSMNPRLERLMAGNQPFLRFQSPMDDPDNPDFASYTFQANTSGAFFIPVPFKYRVKMDWRTQIHTMTSAGRMGPVVMFDPRKGSGYVTDFMHIGYRTPAEKWMFRYPGKHANYWFDKKRAIPMVLQYAMPDPENTGDGPLGSGLMKITYDYGGPDEVSSKAPSTLFESGYIGFMWQQVKFEVRKLQIQGILDKKRAVALLRSFDKTKKSTRRSRSSKKESRKVAETEEKEKEKENEKQDEEAPAAGGKEGIGEDFDF